MSSTLQNKGALVTGGSRGIGRAVVRRLAADGATVVFGYATRGDAAGELAAEVTAAGGRAHPVHLDLADTGSIVAAFAEAEKVFTEHDTGLDIVVANAGINGYGPIAELEPATWERVLRVNATGTFHTLHQAAPRLRDNGRVIAISTTATFWPSSGVAAYAASKAAVEQLCRVASRELGPRGITVNTVSPGPTDTDMLRAGAPQEALDGAAALAALGRIGRPEDIAGVVALLAGPDSAWLTGANLRADGGLT